MVNYMEKHQSIQKSNHVSPIWAAEMMEISIGINGKVKAVWIKEYPSGMICFQAEVKPERMEQ